MVSKGKTLLIVDDEEAIVSNLRWAFGGEYEVVTARTVQEAMRQVRSKKPAVMLLDLSLSGDPRNLEGFKVLDEALALLPLLKVIVMTGHDDKENALEAIAKGAYDFYPKPLSIDHMRVILSRASHIHSLESEILELRKETGEGGEFAGIIAMSPAMQTVFESVKKIAPADVSVLVTGESGTGKELVARAIHDLSPRRDKPFVAINCGAIPENLLESELFGHEKGSFTGAHTSRPGKFESADGGTIFLDEVGELGLPLQVKLLRFLQDHTIERVGGRSPMQVDVRIVAASNQDLEQMIVDRRFREDLYYRIDAIRLNLPPLRERGDDIVLIATRFLHRYNQEYGRNVRGFSEAATRLLYSYNWPGNVRELENRIKRAVLMAAGRKIDVVDLDLPDAHAARDAEGRAEAVGIEPTTLKAAREAVERRLVVAALMRSGGNVSTTARELDVSRPTLHDLMKKHGIDPAHFRRRG